METKAQLEIDWLGLSPRVMACVMEISEKLGVPPKKAFELMVEEAAMCGADVHQSLPKKKMTKSVAKTVA